MPNNSFADEVVDHMPKLTAYARRLAGRTALAEDVVQETVLRALAHRDQYQAGTTLSGCLFTIVRNCVFNKLRRPRRYSAIEDERPEVADRLAPTDPNWTI